MKNVNLVTCCGLLLVLAACDSNGDGGDDPMTEMDAGAEMETDAGPVLPGDGGLSLGGCEAGEPCRCPMGSRDGHAYIFCPDGVIFANAQAACASAGMRLVTIDSATEQEWVWTTSGTMFLDGTKDVWIGLGDRETEGEYVWADGSPLGSYANWIDGQPDNGADFAEDEDCVELSQDEDGAWNDVDCALDYLGFICEG